MKTSKLNILVLTAIAGTAFSAQAGEKAGNGGVAYVCRDARGEITKARLLDLWEPQGFVPDRTDAITEEKQLRNAVEKVRQAHPENMDVLETYIARAQASAFHGDKPLPLSNDALPDYRPDPGCDFEQVALYGWVNETSKYQLRIYDPIFNSPLFSASDRAALWLHEGLYQIDSKFHDAANSRRTRSIVAEIFSSKPALSGPIARNLSDLMQMPEGIANALTLALNPAGQGSFVVAVNGIAGFYSDRSGYPQCSIQFEQNGRVLKSIGGDDRFTIDGIYMGANLYQEVEPGLLNFSLECTGVFYLELHVYHKGVDVTNQVIGAGASRLDNRGGAFQIPPTVYRYSAFLK